MSFLLLHSPAPHALEDDNIDDDGTALDGVSPLTLQDDEEVGQGTHQTEAAIDGVFALLKSPAQGSIEQQEYNDDGNGDEAVAQDDNSLLQIRSNVDFSSFALKPPRASSSALAMPPRTASPMMAMMSSLMEGSTPTLIRRDNTGSRRGNNNTYGSSLHVGRQTVTTQYSYNDSLANYTVNNDNDNEGDSVNYSYEGPHKSWHIPPTSPSLPTMTTTTTTKRTAYALSSNGDAVLSTSPVVSVNEFQNTNNSSSTLTSAARGAGRGNDAGDVVNLSISVSSGSIGNARRGPSPQALPHAGSQVSAMSWRTLEGRAGQDASSLNTPTPPPTNTPMTRTMNGDGSTVSLHVSGYQFGPTASQGSVRGRGEDEDGSSLSAINAMAEGQAPYNYGTPTLTASQRARLRRRRRRRLGRKSRSSLSSPSFSSSVSSGSGNSGSGGIFALPTAGHTTQHASPASGYTQSSISPGRATPSRSHAHPSHYHHHHPYYSSASLRSPASNAMDGEGEDTGEDDMQDLAVAIMMKNAAQPQSVNSVDRTEEGEVDDSEYVWDGEGEEEGVVVVGRDGGSVSDGQLDELSETEEARWYIAQPTAQVNTTLSPSSNETLDMLMASLVHEAAYVRSPVVELGDMRINQQHHHNHHHHVNNVRRDEGNTTSHNVVTHELQYSNNSISDSSSNTATAEWRNAITHGATQPTSVNMTSRRDGGSGSGTWESAAERLERHVSDVVGRVARSYLQPWATRKPWSTTVNNSNGNGVQHVSDTHPAHDNNNNNTSVPRRERRSQPTAGADKHDNNIMTTITSKGNKAGRATQPEVMSSSLSTSFGSSGPRVQDNSHTNSTTTAQRRTDYTNKHSYNNLNGTAMPGSSSTRGEGSQQGGMGSHGNSMNVSGASTIIGNSKSKAKGSGLSAAQRAAIPKPPSLTPPQRRLSDTKRMMAQYDPPSVTFSHEPHVVTQNNNSTKNNDDVSKARTAQLNVKAAAAVAVLPRRDKASEAHMTSIESARGQKSALPYDTQPSSGTRAATPFTLTASHASSVIGMTANKQEVSKEGSDTVTGKKEVMTRPDAHVDQITLSDSNSDNNDAAPTTSAVNTNNDDISRSNNNSRAGHAVPPQPPTTHPSTIITITNSSSSSSRKTYSLPHPPPPLPPPSPQPAGMKSTDGSEQVSPTKAGSPGRQGESETEEEQQSTTHKSEGDNSNSSSGTRQTCNTAASREGGMAPQKNSNNNDGNAVEATTNAASSATVPPSQPRRRGRSRDDYLPPRAAAHNDTSALPHTGETKKKEEEAEGTRQSDTATGNSDSAHNVNSSSVVVAVTLPPAPMPGILLHRRVFDPTQRHSRLLPARRHLPHGQRRANWTPVYLTSQTESDLISFSSDSDNDEEEEEENNRRIRQVIEEIRGRSADNNNNNNSVKDEASDEKKKTGKPARRLVPLNMGNNNNNNNSTGAGNYTQKGAGGNAEMEHSLTACILPAVPVKEEEERTAGTELPSSTSTSSTTTAPSQQSHKHSASALRGNRFAARHIVVDELDKEAEVEGRRRQKRKAEAEAAAALSTPLQDGTRTSDEQRGVSGQEKIIVTSTATRSMLSQSSLSSTSESTYNKASGPTAMTLAIPMWATRNSLQSISPAPAYLNMATSDVSSGSNATSVTQRPSGPRPLSYLPPPTTTAAQQQKERLASSTTTTNAVTRSPPSFSQYAHRRYSAPTPGSRQEDTSATLSANLTRRASQSLLVLYMEPVYDPQYGACLVFDTSALVMMDNPVHTLWSFEQGNDVAVIPHHVMRELHGLARYCGKKAASSSPSTSQLATVAAAGSMSEEKDNLYSKARAISNFLTDLKEHMAKQGGQPAQCEPHDTKQQQQQHKKKKKAKHEPPTCESSSNSVHRGVILQRGYEMYGPLSALSRKPDTDIVSCTVYFANTGRPPSLNARRVMKPTTVLVTNDVMMKLKAMAYDIPVMSYDEVRQWMGKE